MSEQQASAQQRGINIGRAEELANMLLGEKPAPLPGRNILQLNGAAMVRAMQHYVDTVICASPGMMRVVEVQFSTATGRGDAFIVTIEGPAR